MLYITIVSIIALIMVIGAYLMTYGSKPTTQSFCPPHVEYGRERRKDDVLRWAYSEQYYQQHHRDAWSGDPETDKSWAYSLRA